MLERELWKKLPMAQGTMPDLASALGGNSQNGLLAKTGSSSSLSASATTASQNGTGATTSDGFDAYLVQGNPWRATQGQPAVQCHALCSPLLSSPLLCSPLLSSAASGHNTVQSSVCCANHLIAVLFSWILLIGQAADSELQ